MFLFGLVCAICIAFICLYIFVLNYYIDTYIKKFLVSKYQNKFKGVQS